jgi:hypothetical protein
MNSNQSQIDRLGADMFIANIVSNIQEDLNGNQSKQSIADYYISNYSIDVTFSEDLVNVRLYTEDEGFKQASHKVKLNVITNSN